MDEVARVEMQLPPLPPPLATPVVCAVWSEGPAGGLSRAEHFIEWVELLRAFGVRSLLLYMSTVTCHLTFLAPLGLPFYSFRM